MARKKSPKRDIEGRIMDHRRRDPKTGRTKFERWILEAGGTGTIARVFGVKQNTVVGWCNRQAVPKLKYCLKFVELSKGKLSFQDIWEGTRIVCKKSRRN